LYLTITDNYLKYVLFITYYFPPAGGPGVQRVTKFIKYLKDFGWTPIVLAPLNPEYQARDESLAKELPSDLIIRRSPIFEPYKLYRKFTGTKEGLSLDINVFEEGKKMSLKQRIAHAIRATFFIPDARIGWYRSAVNEAMKIAKEYPIAMIYSSSPPYTVSIIARKVAQKTGIPLVAGFRDPWSGFEVSAPKRWFLPRIIDQRLERSVFHDAKKIDVAWKGIALDAIKKYPDLPEDKFIHIPNGFDSNDYSEHDIAKRAERKRGEKFVMTYSGSLYGPRNPKNFFKAIELLLNRNEIDPTKLHLRFVGRTGADLNDMFEAPLIKPLVERIDYVAHSRAVELVSDSDALLLIVDDIPSVEHIVPGKVYEYLGAMRPILAIAEPTGAIGQLLRETHGGEAIAQKDIEGQVRVIKGFYNAWQRGESPSASMDAATISQYERREATRKLSAIFDSLCASK
jgi:glycosyltransferase involved in cell wall biosynthesis